ncbi:MAG: MBL fold metallo-hydrolase [Bacteroidales bacterium]|nr:MBL fold metallo-hydrolase [Bacteroidales bacterium]
MLRTRIFQFNPLGTNCVVAWESDSSVCTVFDPGMSCGEEVSALVDFLREHSLTPEAVLLTHGHFDHVWGVSPFLEYFPVPVYMDPADMETVQRGAQVFRGIGSFKSLRTDFKTVDVPDEVTTGGVTWKVIRTPGHTPGGVCYHCEKSSLLVSGDTLFAGAIGRTDLAGGDYDVLMKSLLERVMTLPEDTDVIPGHGRPTSIGHEAATNPFLLPFNEPDQP